MLHLVHTKIVPFNVPKKVTLIPKNSDDDFEFLCSINELTVGELEALCEEFTDAVFSKAGKVRPGKR